MSPLVVAVSSQPQLSSESAILNHFNSFFHKSEFKDEKNEQSLEEECRAGWRVRRNANALVIKGVSRQGKAKKQILCTSASHLSPK